MKKLLRGIVDFRRHVLPEVRETFERLALGQKPDALFIACSDSRVVPNLFASTDPGDLFVIRNVGNLVPPWSEEAGGAERAAIEFAVSILRVRDIIVCGHSECGAALVSLGHLKNAPSGVCEWLHNADDAVERLNGESHEGDPLSRHDQLSQVSTLVQLDHLRMYPMVRDRLDAGDLNLHAWWFNIKEASVYDYDFELEKFCLIDEARAQKLLESSTEP